jgi:hypothetical protein
MTENQSIHQKAEKLFQESKNLLQFTERFQMETSQKQETIRFGFGNSISEKFNHFNVIIDHHFKTMSSLIQITGDNIRNLIKEITNKI